MAKQEVLDAINATVAPNNIKGITADSLRNVLTLMAENAGSGSGEGALRVMVPMDMFADADAIETDFTPESWETMKQGLDVLAPGLSAALDPVVEELFRHNAEVYPLLMEKGAKNEGVMCLLDGSAWLKEMMVAFAMTEGAALSFNAFSLSTPSAAMIIETEPAEMAAEMAIPAGLNIKPLSHNDINGISPFTAVELRADGTVRMYIDAYDIDYVYVPENDEGVLSDNQKAINALWKQQGDYSAINEVRLCDSYSTYSAGNKTVASKHGEVHYLQYLQYDKTTGITYFKQATIADDGSVTVTTLGVINPPATE